jgi:hypothetical protein
VTRYQWPDQSRSIRLRRHPDRLSWPIARKQSLASALSAAQHFLRGLGQIVETLRQLLEFTIEHGSVILPEATPILGWVDLHVQQYSRFHFRSPRNKPPNRTRFALPAASATIQSEQHQADVAQLVEQLIRNQQVVSSSLTVGSIVHLPSPIPHRQTEFDIHGACGNPTIQGPGWPA